MPEGQARQPEADPDFDPAWEPQSGLSNLSSEDDSEVLALRGTLYHGRNRFFTYDGSGISVPDAQSCGQQAIATMLDFWDAAHFGFQRTDPGPPPARDGRLHFPPAYVGAVYRHYPPVHVPFFPRKHEFTLPNQIEDALRQHGLRTSVCHSAAFGDGQAELAVLKRMVGQYRIPAVCLLDLDAIWPGQGNTAHFGFICGYSGDHVLMASWSDIYSISWDAFMAGWHCRGFPWPYNFHAIFAHR